MSVATGVGANVARVGHFETAYATSRYFKTNGAKT